MHDSRMWTQWHTVSTCNQHSLNCHQDSTVMHTKKITKYILFKSWQHLNDISFLVCNIKRVPSYTYTVPVWPFTKQCSDRTTLNWFEIKSHVQRSCDHRTTTTSHISGHRSGRKCSAHVAGVRSAKCKVTVVWTQAAWTHEYTFKKDLRSYK